MDLVEWILFSTPKSIMLSLIDLLDNLHKPPTNIEVDFDSIYEIETRFTTTYYIEKGIS